MAVRSGPIRISHGRARSAALVVLLGAIILVATPWSPLVGAADPTPTPDIRVPAGPAVDEGSSGANVRSRTDRGGSSSIPEALATAAATAVDPKQIRLDDPVLRWLPEILVASEKWSVPPEILAGIIRIESQGEPGPISPAGARGLVQMMPDGLISHGVPESLWHDPATNIETGAWGLAWRFNAQGSWAGAVGAYLGFGCDVYGTCTDVYVRVVMGWADYYRPIIADPLHSGIAVLPADWTYGPIRIFQMPNPPTPEPPPTQTPTPTGTIASTSTPEPGEPTSTQAPPTPTPKPGEPTSAPPTAEPTVVVPTVVPPTDVPPTAVPTEPPPPATEVPTEPPPPPTEPPPPPTEVPAE